MKKKLLFIFLGFYVVTKAQTKLMFNYDNTGNQTVRELCLSNCTSKPSKEVPIEIEALTEKDLQKFSSEDVISFYPNPVKEELFLKWQLTEQSYVTSILVYNLSGQILKSYSKIQDTNYQNISFQEYPVGVYIVVLIYSNDDQKTIKIIKQ